MMFGFAVPQDFVAFSALRKSAHSRIEVMETSCEDLRDALKQVKVCPAQCQNLVQTCLDGTEKLKSYYSAVSDSVMWQLYFSKKLPYLISSLIRLLSTLGSSKDLVQACGSEWGRMALVLSVPPSAKKTLSKFDILINELSWNLDTIYYALQLTGDMEFKWNDSSRRYVYEKKLTSRSWLPDRMLQSTKDETLSPEDMELYEKSEVIVYKDREHLLRNLQNGSLLTPENFVPDLSQAGKAQSESSLRDYFSSVLIKRLEFKPEEISEAGKDLNPECFRVSQKDLKFRKRLYETSLKSVYRGDWCGQTVAIGVSRSAEEKDVKREAAVMLKVQHPNIIDFLGWSFTEDAQPPVKSSASEPGELVAAGYLVMEWMPDGDLRKAIDLHVKTTGSSFDLVVGVDVLLQIAGAMVHMHNHDLMHRDLKAANCLVEGRSSLESNSLKLYTVKLIDFETSKIDDPNASIRHHTMKTGTSCWMAPEVVWGNSVNSSWPWKWRWSWPWYCREMPCTPYTRSADVYSFGMVCYEVISGLRPFQNELEKKIYKNNADVYIAVGRGKRPSLPPCPKSLEELVVKCWAQNPSARPIFRDIQKSLWTIKKELELQ